MPVIPVSYYYQTDNLSGQGYRECSSTSNAALANHLLGNQFDRDAAIKGISQPEQIYIERLRKYGDTTDHNANTRCLQSFGIESAFFTNLTNADYFKSIANNIPMVLGLIYKGGGHIVLGVGHSENRKSIIINDPFGSRDGKSDNWLSTSPESGKGDVYSLNTFNMLWEGHLGQGYGRRVYSVNGISTNLS
jgi:hypothetical protein